MEKRSEEPTHDQDRILLAIWPVVGRAEYGADECAFNTRIRHKVAISDMMEIQSSELALVDSGKVKATLPLGLDAEHQKAGFLDRPVLAILIISSFFAAYYVAMPRLYLLPVSPSD